MFSYTSKYYENHKLFGCYLINIVPRLDVHVKHRFIGILTAQQFQHLVQVYLHQYVQKKSTCTTNQQKNQSLNYKLLQKKLIRICVK